MVSFAETSNTIPFVVDASEPGNGIGTLLVTLASSTTPGTTASLRFDAPGAALSNQAGSVPENVANGALALVHGSVTVTTGLPAPAVLTATATGTSQIDVIWSSGSGATQYELWRKFD